MDVDVCAAVKPSPSSPQSTIDNATVANVHKGTVDTGADASGFGGGRLE